MRRGRRANLRRRNGGGGGCKPGAYSCAAAGTTTTTAAAVRPPAIPRCKWNATRNGTNPAARAVGACADCRIPSASAAAGSTRALQRREVWTQGTAACRSSEGRQQRARRAGIIRFARELVEAHRPGGGSSRGHRRQRAAGTSPAVVPVSPVRVFTGPRSTPRQLVLRPLRRCPRHLPFQPTPAFLHAVRRRPEREDPSPIEP
ncbi:hypothetical protein PAHAL_5G032300 [Panicum hallii]|uniref:Uncharacterized protein n=1 Tax=Panicum hallii TaxID=206008 RepID=A0A2S3HNG3_9POAL|nr:hypothetical protein PAHAL_5G032300 [Panicum hallii]